MLVAGEPDLSLTAMRGEVVRLYLTNTANTRVFNVTIPGAQDEARRRQTAAITSTRSSSTKSSSRRPNASSSTCTSAQPGSSTLDHQTPDRTYTLATIAVDDDSSRPRPQRSVRYPADECRHDRRARAAGHLLRCPRPTRHSRSWQRWRCRLPRDPSSTRAPCIPRWSAEEPDKCPKCGMRLLPTSAPAETSFVCPMHPEVTSNSADRCPKCGMKLVAAGLVGSGAEEAHGDHEHQHGHGDHEGHNDHGHPRTRPRRWPRPCPWSRRPRDRMGGRHGRGEPDDHPVEHPLEADRPRDRRGERTPSTGASASATASRSVSSTRWTPTIRCTHPFHVHGAGRFLILARDDVEERNLVWKDTVLVRTGETVDILLDVTNPGTWMAHCHIAEHHESGMMLTLRG